LIPLIFYIFKAFQTARQNVFGVGNEDKLKKEANKYILLPPDGEDTALFGNQCKNSLGLKDGPIKVIRDGIRFTNAEGFGTKNKIIGRNRILFHIIQSLLEENNE
jgi:hypothetical protein